MSLAVLKHVDVAALKSTAIPWRYTREATVTWWQPRNVMVSQSRPHQAVVYLDVNHANTWYNEATRATLH
jgi:hypothetical protein